MSESTWATHAERYGVPVPDHLTHDEAEMWVEGYRAAKSSAAAQQGFYLKSGDTITNVMGAGMRTFPVREPVTISEGGMYVAQIHPDGTATLTRSY